VTLVVAGLDLSGWSGRIEQDRVGELAAVLRREKIDVLAVQGITRYPTLTTRTDFVDELARAMEYRQAFGETISLSGRETGNAVFSAYPIQSSDNRHYEGLSGTGFESAMHALVDAGAREIAFVSTRTPGQPSAADRTRCQQTIDSIAGLYGGGPVVVLGNLASLRPGQGWTDASPGAGASGRLWFTGGGLTGSGSRTVQTVFGPLTVIDLEVSGKPAP